MKFKFLLLALAAVVRAAVSGETAGDGFADLPEVRPTDEAYLSGHPNPLRIRGTVNNAFPDEVDPDFLYLILSVDGQDIPVSIRTFGRDHNRLVGLIGREVEVGGVLRTTSDIVSRAFLGRMICVNRPDYVRAVDTARDPFAAPELDLPRYNLPADLARLGNRRVRGGVLAVWGGTEALVRPDRGRPVRLSFSSNAKLPAYGSEIEAVGNVETDTFNVYLTHAQWRPAASTNRLVRTVKDLDINKMFTRNFDGRISLYPTVYNGQVLKARGIVRGLSDLDRARFTLEVGGHPISVDASAIEDDELAQIDRGATVEVTGTCVLDTDMWREHAVFPRVRGFLLIPNLPSDIVVIARPPWLTPERMSGIVLAALACLVAFVVYNRILWLRAFRRGRELSKETLARAEADMRTRERTRLAVELHDSLVQSLSGVIMELDTARRSAPGADVVAARHVVRAEQMLRSCHADLRNCLWDLRSEALEMTDMKSAIERTLVPHVRGVDLDIRFNVARVRLADNTAHMILRAIRELVLNAIRHGGAKKIRIAGAIDGDRLLISVRDDGRGFDPDLAPGVTDGHFGLEGIRERLRNLSGTFDLASEPGRGTRAVLTIPVPKGETRT